MIYPKPTLLLYPQISQYYGHWAREQPDVLQGNCVRSVLSSEDDTDRHQEWELTTCEELLPFMCMIPACPQVKILIWVGQKSRPI